ncbi:MAG: hypothetical protein HQ402_01525 [Parcubacteria group bacterium]|nr:hypothetical protein [Parcubacteria group bacterium]
MLADLFSLFTNEVSLKVFRYLYFSSPIWLPIILGFLFMEIWFRYIRTKYIEDQGFILLEVKLPKEINKSPLAMELVFIALYQVGSPKNYMETYLDGKIKPWYSFELVSLEGQVKFYIWTAPKFKNLIEAQIYAQYPTVEIYEVEDYAKKVHVDTASTTMWGTYFKLGRADAYPIKTYVDYGMDKDPKEEFKIDPMTSVLEYLGSMKKGEQAWLQILVSAHRTGKPNKHSEWVKEGYLKKRYDWSGPVKQEIKDLLAKLKSEEEGVPDRRPTKGEADTISAIERSLSKYPFEIAIRGFYIAKNEVFNSIGITGLIGAFRQYSSPELNSFKLGKFTDYDNPWQDFRRRRRTQLEKEMLEAYKLRSFFQPPYKYYRQKPFILTTEELATIYHFPGGVASTPTILKTSSKKAEPPVNLPI